jgi:hypothetical protein
MAPMTFSLICFRLKTLPGSQDNSNSLNSKLVEALNRKGDILVTHTVKHTLNIVDKISKIEDQFVWNIV